MQNGLDLDSKFQWVNDQLGWGPYSPPTKSPSQDYSKSFSSLKELWDHLVGIIPYEQCLFWFLEQYFLSMYKYEYLMTI